MERPLSWTIRFVPTNPSLECPWHQPGSVFLRRVRCDGDLDRLAILDRDAVDSRRLVMPVLRRRERQFVVLRRDRLRHRCRLDVAVLVNDDFEYSVLSD